MAIQAEMPWLCEVKRPQLAPMDLVKACRHRLDAIRLCVQLSHLSNDTVAESLGIDPGHFTRIMQGRANFPDAKSVLLMRRCENYAPLQYEAWATGFALVPNVKEQRLAQLDAERAALLGAA